MTKNLYRFRHDRSSWSYFCSTCDAYAREYVRRQNKGFEYDTVVIHRLMMNDSDEQGTYWVVKSWSRTRNEKWKFTWPA